MTDLDVATAQLIIRLAREDLYEQFDLDDASAGLNNNGQGQGGLSLTDAEYALAMQEQEFMQFWIGYGEAQQANRPPNRHRTSTISISSRSDTIDSNQSNEVNNNPDNDIVEIFEPGPSSILQTNDARYHSGVSGSEQIDRGDETDDDDGPIDLFFARGIITPPVEEVSSVDPDVNSLYSVEAHEESDVESVASLPLSLDVRPISGSFIPSVEEQVECIFCKEDGPISTTLRVQCNHYICRTCITRSTELCLRDETAYPIKCCQQPVSDQTVVAHISNDLGESYQAKCREYNTPIPNRVYCHRCGDFLQKPTTTSTTPWFTSRYPFQPIPSSDSRILPCAKCNCSTCMDCKQAAHPQRPCADSPGDVAVKGLAQQKGWQTCPECKAIVELVYGCYHITCRCHAQFCYLCAVKWKNCRCPQFEEQRLLQAV
ncbi:hypothetical protein AMATHDRAFT_61537 [Amanita thiersii Skay4041]|uniref:RING-type domain-containing protein n=1 Tax=Amanita thiersii Skay4041 TaxID=703135 RepID=A0A2A9NHW5_9AGAR|nr:hypothetical protein AMATHDRAFT_61537 [Amanita thiersii Skay4041]